MRTTAQKLRLSLAILLLFRLFVPAQAKEAKEISEEKESVTEQSAQQNSLSELEQLAQDLALLESLEQVELEKIEFDKLPFPKGIQQLEDQLAKLGLQLEFVLEDQRHYEDAKLNLILGRINGLDLLLFMTEQTDTHFRAEGGKIHISPQETQLDPEKP